MKLQKHVVISTAAGAALYAATGSAAVAAPAVLTGIFLDLDHFIDYFLNFGFKLGVRDFFRKCERCEMRKLVVVLHSYELVAALAAACALTHSRVLLGAVIGMTVHLVPDMFSNFVWLSTYSFICRWRKNFEAREFFTWVNKASPSG